MIRLIEAFYSDLLTSVDFGLPLARLVAQLGPALALFNLWARASALPPHPASCIVIPAGDLWRARSILDAFPAYVEAKVQRHGKYLGIMVGPEAQAHQWEEVRAKARAWVGDIRFQGQI